MVTVYKTVLFLQGCNLKCSGCQNQSTWDINKGKLIDVKELALQIRKKCKKRITITYLSKIRPSTIIRSITCYI